MTIYALHMSVLCHPPQARHPGYVFRPEAGKDIQEAKIWGVIIT